MKTSTLAMAVAAAAVIIIIVAIVAAVEMDVSAAPQARPTSFSFNGITYPFTMVASTPTEQEQGLMNYTVTNSTFELFQFQYGGDYPFWMKNTYYPLDIIWIYNDKVVYVVNATPCVSYSANQSNCIVYDPKTFATDVIEARSGFVNATGLRVGDSVNIS